MSKADDTYMRDFVIGIVVIALFMLTPIIAMNIGYSTARYEVFHRNKITDGQLGAFIEWAEETQGYVEIPSKYEDADMVKLKGSDGVVLWFGLMSCNHIVGTDKMGQQLVDMWFHYLTAQREQSK